jgi:hypothetical protein
MGESRHQKPQITARPPWPVDAVSDCTSGRIRAELHQKREMLVQVADRAGQTGFASRVLFSCSEPVFPDRCCLKDWGAAQV